MRVLIYFALASLIAILAACSDSPGGGGIGGTGKADGTVMGSGILIGQIEAFDDVVIDSQRFNTDQSEIIVNGDISELSDLRIGMSVTATVDYNQQTAKKIEYQPIVAGPIQFVSEIKTTLTILNQKILLSEDTILDDLTLEDIFDGVVIEVNGDRDASNTIIADYIRLPDMPDNFFIVGKLESVAPESDLTQISGTVVDFQPLFESIETEFAQGATIKAELDIVATAGDLYVASNVAGISDIDSGNFETIVVNGVVSTVIDNQSFVVRKFVFQTNTETVFQNRQGETIAPLSISDNTKLTVTGLSLNNGKVLATKIKIKK